MNLCVQRGTSFGSIKLKKKPIQGNLMWMNGELDTTNVLRKGTRVVLLNSKQRIQGQHGTYIEKNPREK